jgi:hypothetical protein
VKAKENVNINIEMNGDQIMAATVMAGALFENCTFAGEYRVAKIFGACAEG